MTIQKIYILVSTDKQEAHLISSEEGIQLIECGYFKHKVETQVTFYREYNHIQQASERHYIYVDNIISTNISEDDEFDEWGILIQK